MDAAFQQAASPKLRKVLGFELQQLTLGHRFILVRHEASYVREGKAGLEDLMLSVFVCSQPWRDAERGLSAWWFRSFVWLWSLRLRKTILPIEHQIFRLYWDESHAVPDWIEGGAEVEAGSPYEQRVLAMLMADFGMTKDEALDTPLVSANALWVAEGERTGKLLLKDRRIEALIAEARRRDLEKYPNGLPEHMQN